MDNSELQKRHFVVLKGKYQVPQFKPVASDSFLYLILRKAASGIQVTDLELNWLAQHQLSQTAEIILLQQYQAEEQKRLEAEFLQLRTKCLIPEELELDLSSPIYSVLWKVDSGQTPTEDELQLLRQHNLIDTIDLIQNVVDFATLKAKYHVTKYFNSLPEEPLYSILKKLSNKVDLSKSEAKWLLENGLQETWEIHFKQQQEKQADREFLELKAQYQVDFHPDQSSSSPLYTILRKLTAAEELEHQDCEWLEQHKLSNLLKIDRVLKDKNLFVELKKTYQATHYQDADPASPLFPILRSLEIHSLLRLKDVSQSIKELVDSEQFQLHDKDIQWLAEAGLTVTTRIAKDIHFKILKNKYRIVGQLELNPFYEIMLKLEREERLAPKQVIQLIEEGHLSAYGKIAISHYRLEAIYYEKEYQRTGNRWHLPSASSNWRKANQPKQALNVTEKLNWNKVQEPKLKAALLVTRGGAFRDLDELNEAEKCAKQAMECQPDSHQPYTLMGAICYGRSDYDEGDRWFEKAIACGAKDTDNEIERIVRMTKDKEKRREAAEYLLKKNPHRYRWAEVYTK